MADSMRKELVNVADRLGVIFKKSASSIAHSKYRAGAREISRGVNRLKDADNIGAAALKRHDFRKAAYLPSPSRRPLSSPIGPNTFDIDGRPVTQRRYLKDDYITMWERTSGRKMTPDQRMVLDQGCIGVTKVRIGMIKIHTGPPMNLAFADPSAHLVIRKAENFLTPGEAANARVKYYRRELAKVQDVISAHGLTWAATDRYGVTRQAADHLHHVESNLLSARSQARDIWSSLAKGEIKDMRVARNDARIESDNQTFAKVSNYAQRFNDILATKPADIGEFLHLVKADPDLAQLRGVDERLPPGDPSEWQAIVYSKHFWSGQVLTRDVDGNPLPRSPIIRDSAETSDVERFAPDPATGQVDMSDDYNFGKPGYVNFDYGFYDDQTKNWWHANHYESGDPDDPMKVFQSTSETFFKGYTDFDSSVICIGFVRNAPGNAG